MATREDIQKTLVVLLEAKLTAPMNGKPLGEQLYEMKAAGEPSGVTTIENSPRCENHTWKPISGPLGKGQQCTECGFQKRLDQEPKAIN